MNRCFDHRRFKTDATFTFFFQSNFGRQFFDTVFSLFAGFQKLNMFLLLNANLEHEAEVKWNINLSWNLLNSNRSNSKYFHLLVDDFSLLLLNVVYRLTFFNFFLKFIH